MCVISRRSTVVCFMRNLNFSRRSKNIFPGILEYRPIPRHKSFDQGGFTTRIGHVNKICLQSFVESL